LKPYDLKEGDVYRYLYRESFKGKERGGEFLINVLGTDRGYRVRVEGRYHRWRGRVEGVFRDAEHLAGYIAIRMYFQHWLIPLGRTLFSRGLVKVLRSDPPNLSREGTPCEVAGFEGGTLELRDGYGTLIRVCLHPRVPLPLYVFRRDREGNRFEIRLVAYRSEEGDPQGDDNEAEDHP
jgi:hypothetical protein